MTMPKILKLLCTMLCALAIGLSGQLALAQTTGQIVKNNCDACANFCAKTLNYCVSKRGAYGKDTVTTPIKDAISCCKSSSELLSRSSALQNKSIAMTIDALNECVKVCEGFPNDNNMKACADECRKCGSNLAKVKPQ